MRCAREAAGGAVGSVRPPGPPVRGRTSFPAAGLGGAGARAASRPDRGTSLEGHIPHGQQTFCSDVRPQTGFDAFAAIIRIQALFRFPKKG